MKYKKITMNLFDVYPLYDIVIEKGKGNYVWDNLNTRYLDLYGGHAVISVGHSHPEYVAKITNQLNKIGFYSNSIQIPIQKVLAEKLGIISGKEAFQLFLCNSGAEANENALKLASFHNGRKKIIAFTKSFHGRTSLAVAATDNSSIIAPVNATENVVFLPFNDVQALEKAFLAFGDEISSVIIEGIQGVGGINIASDEFLKKIRTLCTQYNAVYIADAVQCGYGRSGKFFAHDYAGVDADIYSLAKGMGNGFPVAGIIITPHIAPKMGMLGTTFGGNHLACAAALSVLEIIENENLIVNAENMGNYVSETLQSFPKIKEIRGRGLMIGIEFDFPAEQIRKKLLFDHHIFTGSSSNKNTLRLLPALSIGKKEMDIFLEALTLVLK
jgi:acetylornithine/N-succinyldiaminopimelate aminotransferase